MSARARSWTAALAGAAAFAWVALALFNRQFASGELYPVFSSLRTGPAGTCLLYDSLARLPGLRLERNYMPLAYWQGDDATLLLLGVPALDANWNEGNLLSTATRLASRGNRVVIALYRDPGARWKQADLDSRPASDGAAKDKPAAPAIDSLWQLRLGLDSDPAKPHPLFIARAAGWSALESEDGKLIRASRPFGRGSIVITTESADFSNRATVSLERLGPVIESLGVSRHIVFDERHLGLAESGSVVAIARHFRLAGLACGLALLAALFLWRNATSFPPRLPASIAAPRTGRASGSGLLTLLARHIPPRDAVEACWRAWVAANRDRLRPELVSSAEAILATNRERPLEAMRALQSLLNTKGHL
jgi:hypothetical protein